MNTNFLDEKSFEKLFPFYFVLDANLNFVQAGKSLTKLIAGGGSFVDTFRFLRPGLGIEYTFASMRSYSDQVFIVQLRDSAATAKFKGQFIYVEEREQLIFCGSPWITSEETFEKLNLAISDFAIHDSVIDRLQLLNAQKMELQERLRLDHELAGQRSLYQNLFDNIPVDIALIDAQHKFRYINKSAVKNVEMRKWIIGKTATEYYLQKGKSQEFISGVTNSFNAALFEKKRINFEQVHNENTSDEQVMLRSVMPFITSDGSAYILAYGFDVTEIRKSKNELIHKNAELQKLNAELDSLVYSVTHDLRSPVLSVMGLIDLSLKTGKPSEELVAYLNLMKRSLDRLDDTIREILTYSRNAKLELEIEQIDISAMVQEIFENVSHVPKFKVICTQELIGTTPLYSDEKRVMSIMNNLISNAVKYSRKGYTDSFVKVKINTNDKECVITVEDNGEGILEEHQDKVFNMFHRASTSSTGSGLGLFICSEVIRKLGGEISMHSVSGQGSIFKVIIPNKINNDENRFYSN